MPECRVVPCFKIFLSELKEILSTSTTAFIQQNQTAAATATAAAYISSVVNIEPPSQSINSYRHNLHINMVDYMNRGIQTNLRIVERNRGNSGSSSSSSSTGGDHHQRLQQQHQQQQQPHRQVVCFLILFHFT